MLQVGQRLAAQRAVEAEEAEQRDQLPAGTVRVAARLGGHAQLQELKGKAAGHRGGSDVPNGAGAGRRQLQWAPLRELASPD